MFKTMISHTPITSDAANNFFQNIGGDAYRGDISFIATMRALLAPRIGDEEEITIQFTNSNYRVENLNGASARDCVHTFTSSAYIGSSGYFIIHNFNGPHDGNLASMKAVEEGFTEMYRSYRRLGKITEFFKKSFPVICFVNQDSKSVVMFVENLDYKRLHYLQIGILPAMPWYFNPAEGLSDIEMELIQSLKEQTSEKYEACIREIASKYDFRAARIRKMLSGFENRYTKSERNRVQAEIAEIDREIGRLNESIGEYYKSRSRQCAHLFGLEEKLARGDENSEIMEYFLCNKKLYLESVSGSEVYFCVADYLSYFDKEMVERVLNNRSSYIYTTARGSIHQDDMARLIQAIFIDETLHIKFCAAYQFNLAGNVRAQGNHGFPDEFVHFMPNTHINRYMCMGGYERTINSLLKNKDYVGAFEQCIASCKSLNWGDYTVMNRFMVSLYNDEGSWIELPDGRYVKPSAAVKWLNEQEEASGTEEQEETTHE